MNCNSYSSIINRSNTGCYYYNTMYITIIVDILDDEVSGVTIRLIMNARVVTEPDLCIMIVLIVSPSKTSVV